MLSESEAPQQLVIGKGFEGEHRGPRQEAGLCEQDREEFRLDGAETSSWEQPSLSASASQ
ncbi:MAG: hypothetical protein A2719_04440 [Candidatus Ryanbacteria bacterium RIFCSPHIGHO2_01_FULL_45_22]|uniref:Uncharacterized protein n=1 Tax=Candidatus Ryanbacteria bacterium RIFCSPHIGHO2_01_FULL_45_22 TaxID=1802114 RepID=A0A1G2G290_9BACT|nr:MAG: hypothetical protein A2719_04440 [Candidatus Ryanbacteria bacterium RIFCSPHIGHO2_01_FULL_45_22]